MLERIYVCNTGLFLEVLIVNAPPAVVCMLGYLLHLVVALFPTFDLFRVLHRVKQQWTKISRRVLPVPCLSRCSLMRE